KVGSESELGRAVLQLTGLFSLVDLADHVRRAKVRIKEFIQNKTDERGRADQSYSVAIRNLNDILHGLPGLTLEQAIPHPSYDKTIESILDEVSRNLEGARTRAFESARDILGEHFDPSDPVLLSDIEKNIG